MNLLHRLANFFRLPPDWKTLESNKFLSPTKEIIWQMVHGITLDWDVKYARILIEQENAEFCTLVSPRTIYPNNCPFELGVRLPATGISGEITVPYRVWFNKYKERIKS